MAVEPISQREGCKFSVSIYEIATNTSKMMSKLPLQRFKSCNI